MLKQPLKLNGQSQGRGDLSKKIMKVTGKKTYQINQLENSDYVL